MYNKVLAILFSIVIFISNVNASTLISSEKEQLNNDKYIMENYKVSRSEESEFIEKVKKSKRIYHKKYDFYDIEKIGGTDTVTEEILEQKELMNYSYDGELHLFNIPTSIDYNDNGYNGELTLDESSITNEKSYDKEKGIYKYKITATYKATLTKLIETEYIYKVRYIEVQDYTAVPIVSGIILLGVIYKFRKNIKVYNLQYGKWVLIKKARLKKNHLDIGKIKYKEVTSKYKIEVNKSLARKLYDKDLKISKGENIIFKKISNLKGKNIFEIDI